ncbi:MAG: hypothetical protein K5985_10965 [Lachnospiraceae bacterium]|nr:hypothetical protein [Lachnospiraceae bacterium]
MKREHIITILSTLAILTLMVGISELTGRRELIFPEAAALALGVLIPARISWHADGKRLVILYTLSALAGWGIVRFVRSELWLALSFAFLLGQFILLFSDTSSAAVISIIMLPVLLGLDSPLYPLSALCSSVLIVMLRAFLEKRRIKERERRVSMEKPKIWESYDILIRLSAVALLSFLAEKAGWLYLLSPPLLAVFSEKRRYESEYRKTPVRTVLSFVSCALIGVLFRGLLSVLLPLPDVVAAIPAVFGMLAFLLLTSPVLPSAGSMTLLAFMIPSDELIIYPFQVLAGGILLFLWNRFFFKETPDRLESENPNPFKKRTPGTSEGSGDMK